MGLTGLQQTVQGAADLDHHFLCDWQSSVTKKKNAVNTSGNC